MLCLMCLHAVVVGIMHILEQTYVLSVATHSVLVPDVLKLILLVLSFMYVAIDLL